MTIAVVTGSGAAICTYMLDAGYYVISLARRLSADIRCEFVEVDLLDPAATEQAARHAVSHIVHNA